MRKVTLEKRRKSESSKRERAQVSSSSRSFTAHEAPRASQRAAHQAGPLFEGGGDNDDETRSATHRRREAIIGGVVLTKCSEEGGQAILQRLYPSSSAQRKCLKHDAKELKELKDDLYDALQMDERMGNKPVMLGVCVREGEVFAKTKQRKQRGQQTTKSNKLKLEEAGEVIPKIDTIPAKLLGFTTDHLQAEEASNAFLVALRHFSRTYVECWEPLLHSDFREQLAGRKRQRGLDRLRETIGEEQVAGFGSWWTGVRLLEEGSRTRWQSWEGDATPTILIPLGPPVVLETEYSSIELEEGHVCIFDASIKHRIVVSTLRKRKKLPPTPEGEERPWCICAYACRAMMVGRTEGEEEGEEEEDELEEEELEGAGEASVVVADKERLLKNPPEVDFNGTRARTVRT